MLFAAGICCGEGISPFDPIAVLVKCPSLSSFTGIAEPVTAYEAVKAYRAEHTDTGLSDSEIYKAIFHSGEYPEAFICEETELLDAVYSIESSLTLADGMLLVSIRTEVNFGEGYEFWYNADVYLDGETQRIVRVFFPE